MLAETTTVAFGPELPGVGSWEWVGRDMALALGGAYQARTYRARDVPEADIIVVVKQMPPVDWVGQALGRGPLVYCPVDFYDSAAQIDGDSGILRCCTRIVVHSHRLRRYFEVYAPVVYLDHPLKFTAPLREGRQHDGHVLWVGVHTNLPPLVEWVNEHPPPAPLWVLTNLETPGRVPTAGALGFRPGLEVLIGEWSAERQAEWTAGARAALDVKGADFRARNKPPAKALDFLASGVPLALGPGHPAIEHLARLGFDVASPLDEERWLSGEYAEETRRFGAALRELLSPARVGRRLQFLLDEVVAGRRYCR